MPYRRYIWFGLMAAIVMGVLWDLYPLPGAAERLKQLRAQGPHFSSLDIPLTPREKTVLQRAKVIHRRYQFEGRTVFVTVVDGTEDRHAVHDPGYCFRGAGWEVVRKAALSIPGGQAEWLQVRRNADTMEAIFWFSDGRRRHASVPCYWWQTTLRRITLGRSGPEPVMVVLQSNERQMDWPKLAPRLIAALGLSL